MLFVLNCTTCCRCQGRCLCYECSKRRAKVDNPEAKAKPAVETALPPKRKRTTGQDDVDDVAAEGAKKAKSEDGRDWGLLDKQREEDGKEIFQVERVVDEREAADGGTEFLVKWVGWEEASNTWEPEVRSWRIPISLHVVCHIT